MKRRKQNKKKMSAHYDKKGDQKKKGARYGCERVEETRKTPVSLQTMPRIIAEAKKGGEVEGR
jgi:hypothetical protein